MNEQPQQPDGWERLKCSCGQARFAKVVSLRWRSGGGITEEPQGYFCLECHAMVDSAALIHKAQLEVKRRELRELQAEVDESAPTPKKKEKAHAAA